MTITDAPWWSGSPTQTPPVLYDKAVKTSRYVEVSDGCRLATDLWLPAGLADGERIPALISITPYVRGMSYRVPFAEEILKRLGGVDFRAVQEFARYGFAYLHVEMRGAGASYGAKKSIFKYDVVRDGSDVLDWIVAQPWSNGEVGATGISALGLTSMMLATAKHPALKAIAPRFTTFDIFYSVHPGCLLENRFLDDIGRVVRAMDSNRLHEGMESPVVRTAMRALVRGTPPVDDDRDGSQLRAAVAQHAANEGFDLDIATIRHRDDRLTQSSIEATLETQSPSSYVADIIASDVAIYAYDGWMDGAFCRDLINLYLNSPAPTSRLTIGPWAHGGAFYSSPMVSADKRRSEFPQIVDLVRFFDAHLRGNSREASGEHPVHYFTMVEERWKSSPTWPPPGFTPLCLHLGPSRRLSEKTSDSAAAVYKVDRIATTGVWSRYGKHLSGGAGPANYPDRAEADFKLLCFDSEPLDVDTEVTGHPIVTLTMSCDSADGALFVYLEDVGPDGAVMMVSDGCLRLSRRAVEPNPPYRQLGVWHAGRRRDVAPVVPGEAMELAIDLLPTSWLFRAGHRVRIAIGGADADNFVMVPEEGPPPTFTISLGGEARSCVDLPTMRSQR